MGMIIITATYSGLTILGTMLNAVIYVTSHHCVSLGHKKHNRSQRKQSITRMPKWPAEPQSGGLPGTRLWELGLLELLFSLLLACFLLAVNWLSFHPSPRVGKGPPTTPRFISFHSRHQADRAWNLSVQITEFLGERILTAFTWIQHLPLVWSTWQTGRVTASKIPASRQASGS